MSDHDRFLMHLARIPACGTCKWKHSGSATCTAFPNGIPDFILDGENQHLKPVPGNQGIQYQHE